MKNRPRGGLGRGLGALIPTAPAPGSTAPDNGSDLAPVSAAPAAAVAVATDGLPSAAPLPPPVSGAGLPLI